MSAGGSLSLGVPIFEQCEPPGMKTDGCIGSKVDALYTERKCQGS